MPDQIAETLTVPPDADGLRLDVFLLRQALPGTTRADVQRLIRSSGVQIPGKRVIKPGTTVHAGQDVSVQWTAHGKKDVGATPPGPSPMPPLRVIHEDPQLIVLDKPAGVPVHAGVKREPSLADALVARYPALRNIGEPDRGAGIVHRLDKDTSGVLLIARTPAMHAHLKAQFQRRRVRKEYVALVHGVVSEEEGTVKLPIRRSRRNPLRRTVVVPGRRQPLDAARGKAAETSFRVLERFREHTLLVVFPKTGRMHQIRVHLAHLGFPVAGDPLYGRKSRHRRPTGLARQFLHATKLAVTLPSGRTGTFESPLPDDLTRVLQALRRSPSRTEKLVRYRWRTPRRSPQARAAG